MKTQKKDASVNNVWELIFGMFIIHPYLLIFCVLLCSLRFYLLLT